LTAHHTSRRTFTRWLRRLVLFGLTLFTLVTLGAGYWLPAAEDRRPADAIVVLGGGMDVLRINTGAQLYRAGLAPMIWYTGNPGDRLSTRRAEFFRREGYPLHAIVPLASDSTASDATRIAEQVVLRNTKTLVIVTDWFHSRRALATIRTALAGRAITVRYVTSEQPYCTPERWMLRPARCWIIALEPPKVLYYWIRYGIHPWS
jgi:uncharacterized SAM-binding protein YcdF (DUF218 family)